MSEQTKTQSFLEKLKKKATESEKYNEEIFYEEAWIENKNYPNCWASRAKQDGLTHCAYCGFEIEFLLKKKIIAKNKTRFF